MSNNLILSSVPTAKIIGIQFGMLSPEEIEKSSVANIHVRDMYVSNKPVLHSLADIRMGVQDPGIICPTDNLDYVNTPGYHGHINLAVPVFYIQYLKDVKKWTQCVCCECSKLLISKTQYEKLLAPLTAQQRWKKVVQLCKKVKRCGGASHDGCNALQPTKISKEGVATIVAEWSITTGTGENKEIKKQAIKWTPEMLYKRFKLISDDDVNYAGFNSVFSRPEWMICKTFLVPPPAIRPSVKHDAQQRSEDDLTHILLNIIRTNNELVQDIQKNSAANIIDQHVSILQYFIANMVNNNVPGMNAVTNRSGRPFKAIISRLNGKGGRMRGNLMAKRVDFSARSVITGEPNLSITELGIPMPVAMNLTRPEVVNERNRAFLTQLVRNGPDIYPGAKILKRKGSKNPITLRYMERDNIILEDGDVVDRHLMDGDMVLFNRQPTLHRMSMQSFHVRVMQQGNTFRFNVAVAAGFNADFDSVFRGRNIY